MVRVLTTFFVAHQSSRSATVMTIGNIKRRNIGKQFGNAGIGFGVFNHPEMVTKTVTISYKIIYRCTFYYFGNNSIQFILMRIGKKHRLNIGVVYTHVFHAVFFFIATGQFMLFDIFVQIIIYIGTNNQTVLRFSVHGLSIHVVFLHFVLHQPTFGAEFCEIFSRFIIYFFFVLVGSRFKIYFGFNDMVKRQCVSFSFGASFFGIQHIVGARSHFFYQMLRRTNALKRFDNSHDIYFYVCFFILKHKCTEKVLKSGRGNNMENGKQQKETRVIASWR